MKTLLGLGSFILVIACIVSFTVFDRLIPKGQPRTPHVYTRVVALAPSMSETVIALNETHRLVGATIHCDDPKIRDVARVGSFAEPSFEAIMALEPDLVLAVPHVLATPIIDRLRANHVEVFAHQPDTLSDIRFIIGAIAQKFRVAEKGQQLIAAMNEALDHARTLVEALGDSHERTALVLVSASPLVVAGSQSFPSEIISICGLKNMASGGAPWPVWPVELLLSDPPRYLIITAGSRDLTHYQHLWNSIGLDTITKNIRVIVPDYPIFNSPSPTIIKDTLYLAKLLSGV